VIGESARANNWEREQEKEKPGESEMGQPRLKLTKIKFGFNFCSTVICMNEFYYSLTFSTAVVLK